MFDDKPPDQDEASPRDKEESLLFWCNVFIHNKISELEFKADSALFGSIIKNNNKKFFNR